MNCRKIRFLNFFFHSLLIIQTHSLLQQTIQPWWNSFDIQNVLLFSSLPHCSSFTASLYQDCPLIKFDPKMQKHVKQRMLSFTFTVQTWHHTPTVISKMSGDILNIWPLLKKILTYFCSDLALAATLLSEKQKLSQFVWMMLNLMSSLFSLMSKVCVSV